MSKKFIISAVIFIVLTILIGWAYSISSQITAEVKQKQNETKVDNDKVNIEELVITETRNGQKFWEIYASSGKYENSKNVAALKNVIGNFYKNDNVVLSFDAPKALYNSKNKEILLSGGARAATKDKIIIIANEMCWKGNTDLIDAVGNVKIQRDKELLTLADRSTFNTSFTKVKIAGHAQSKMYSK